MEKGFSFALLIINSVLGTPGAVGSMHSLTMDMTKSVLSFGYLKRPLDERNRWLAEAGVQVKPAYTLKEALALTQQGSFDVLIVGPAVPAEERNEVAALARSRNIRTLFLYKENISGAERGDAIISADGSREDLLEAVRALT